MRHMRIRYHEEPEGWWAESPELPKWSAAGDTFAEVQQLAREGLTLFVEEDIEFLEEGVPERIEVHATFDLLLPYLNAASSLSFEKTRYALGSLFVFQLPRLHGAEDRRNANQLRDARV